MVSSQKKTSNPSAGLVIARRGSKLARLDALGEKTAGGAAAGEVVEEAARTCRNKGCAEEVSCLWFSCISGKESMQLLCDKILA
jgi:hypothetical protein